MCKRINKVLSLLLLAVLVFSSAFVTYAADEKTPVPTNVWVSDGHILWTPANEEALISKFKIYYKDKWSGESYKLVATCEGYDSEESSGLNTTFYFRDATNEENPQVIKEKKNGRIYYSIPAYPGHKYKVAVKSYDEAYALWSEKKTAEYYCLTTPPEVTVKQTKKGLLFSWKPVLGATKYYIERNKLSGEYEEDLFKIVGNDQVTFLDEGVIDGEDYLYDVYAARGKWMIGTELDPIRVNLPK